MFRIGFIKNGQLVSISVKSSLDKLDFIKILHENYKTGKQIEELIRKGDIYTIGKNLDATIYYHPKYDTFENSSPVVEDCNSLQDINTGRSPVKAYVIWVTNKWNVDNTGWVSAHKFIKNGNKIK